MHAITLLFKYQTHMLLLTQSNIIFDFHHRLINYEVFRGHIRLHVPRERIFISSNTIFNELWSLHANLDVIFVGFCSASPL